MIAFAVSEAKFKLIVSVESDRDDLPDWGMGPGVLGEQEVVYDVTHREGLLACALAEHSQELVHKLVNVRIEEVKNGSRKSR